MSFCPKVFTIKCCERTYSTADADTNLHLTIYKNTPTKRFYRGEKVWREYTVLLDCVKNNCQVAEVHRYNDKFQKIQRFRLKADNYNEHLQRIQNSKQKIVLRPHLKEKLYFKRIDLKYNKPISQTKGQRRYVNETGYDGYFESEVIDRSFDDALLKEYGICK